MRATRRPERIRILSELKEPRTLPAGEEQFSVVGRGEHTLVLGLGPEPGILAAILPETDVSFVEAPEFAEQMPDGWHDAIPQDWREMEADELTDDIIRTSRILVYIPNPRLFPMFWGPILARCQWALLGDAPPPPSDEVWLPGTARSLLVRELTRAFEASGLTVRLLEPDGLSQELPRLLTEARPRLFFSVNFRGLDPFGEAFHLLRRAGCEVVVWCVDNPFHLLSGVKSCYWRKARLCVTDDWFVSVLGEHGAEKVMHLPLAAWPEHFSDVQPVVEHDAAGHVVFVGRAEFPHKAEFFSGITITPELWEKAMQRMQKGARPDFSWWRRILGIERLWPGKEVRDAGYGAEQSSQAWRRLCLRQAALADRLLIYGDPGWKELVPEVAEIRPEIDYYGPLGYVYRSADAVLNVTSMLLPRGLTQRHFDVWCAGGFLLTDATPGLSIFPEELVREVSFEHPSRIQGIMAKLASRPEHREAVRAAWVEAIRAAHTYRHRVDKVLDWALEGSRPRG